MKQFMRVGLACVLIQSCGVERPEYGNKANGSSVPEHGDLQNTPKSETEGIDIPDINTPPETNEENAVSPKTSDERDLDHSLHLTFDDFCRGWQANCADLDEKAPISLDQWTFVARLLTALSDTLSQFKLEVEELYDPIVEEICNHLDFEEYFDEFKIMQSKVGRNNFTLDKSGINSKGEEKLIEHRDLKLRLGAQFRSHLGDHEHSLRIEDLYIQKNDGTEFQISEVRLKDNHAILTGPQITIVDVPHQFLFPVAGASDVKPDDSSNATDLSFVHVKPLFDLILNGTRTLDIDEKVMDLIRKNLNLLGPDMDDLGPNVEKLIDALLSIKIGTTDDIFGLQLSDKTEFPIKNSCGEDLIKILAEPKLGIKSISSTDAAVEIEVFGLSASKDLFIFAPTVPVESLRIDQKQMTVNMAGFSIPIAFDDDDC